MTAIQPETRIPPILIGLLTQARVIVAMVLRDIVTQVGGSRIGFIMMIARPAAIVILFYIIYGFSRRTPQGMPMLAFLVTGWLSWFALIRTFKYIRGLGTGGGILLFPQVTPLDLFLADMTLEWFVYSNVFFMFLLATFIIERSPLPANPLQVIFAFWGMGYIGAVFAIIFSSFGRVAPVFLTFSIVIRRLGALVSGVAITAADTPPRILDWLKWSPIFQCIELMRTAWWPAYVSPIADPIYLAKCLFFMTAFALALERATRRYIRD